MSDEATRALVLRHFAALRRHGSSAADALNQLLQGLPAGPMHDACTLAARSLASPGAVPTDDLVRVLAAPTGTGEAADNLAASLEARADARDALRSATLLFQVAAAVPLLALSVLGWLNPRGLFTSFGGSLPAPTDLLFFVAELLSWVGVPLVVLSWWVVQRLSRSFAPGYAAFERSARVLERSTRVLPNSDFAELGLSPVEQRLLLALRSNDEPTALKTLGGEFSREGRAAVANFRVFAPLVLGGLGAVFTLGVLAALYLPIFSIAGSIK